MRTVTSLILLLWATALQALESGLYELTSDSKPGKPVPDQISRATLDFTSNDNEDFTCTLSRHDPFSVDECLLVLKDKPLIYGQGMFWLRGGRSAYDNEYRMTASGRGAAIAEDLIRHFNPTIGKRKHPGHRMMAKFIRSKSRYKAGEPVELGFKITNVGDAPFAFQQGGKQRGARDNQFTFSAEEVGEKMLPDIGSPRHMGGLSSYTKLSPGESVEILVDLSNWFNFECGKHYRIYGSYWMELVDPDGIKSSHLPRYLWNDTVSDAFDIGMEE